MPYPDHPDASTSAERRRARQTFHQLMDRQIAHLRVDYSDERQAIGLVGWARDMHGPQGVCTCCQRRPRLTIDGDPVGQVPD